MAALIVLGLSLLLSSPAFAAQYQWSSGVFGGISFVTSSNKCAEVASELIRILNGGVVQAGRNSGLYLWTGTCSSSGSGVGQVITFGQAFVSSTSTSSTTITATMTSFVEDDSSEDVASIPLQKVAVLVGSIVCFFVGAVLGRA